MVIVSCLWLCSIISSTIKVGENTCKVIVTAANPNYSTTYNLDFKEGRKYTLTMNFIGDEVQLITASEENWDTADDVDHVFD